MWLKGGRSLGVVRWKKIYSVIRQEATHKMLALVFCLIFFSLAGETFVSQVMIAVMIVVNTAAKGYPAFEKYNVTSILIAYHWCQHKCILRSVGWFFKEQPYTTYARDIGRWTKGEKDKRWRLSSRTVQHQWVSNTWSFKSVILQYFIGTLFKDFLALFKDFSR